MLTKMDLKKLDDQFSAKFVTKSEFNTRLDNLTKEIVGAITALGEKIQDTLNTLKDHQNVLDDHERRIEKIEEKTFALK